MKRCDRPMPGIYEVTFKYLHGIYGEDRPPEIGDYLAEIGEHGDTYDRFENGALRRDEHGQPIVIEPWPRVSESQPYVGELCEHEYDWLRQIPGRVFSIHRRYTVRRIDEGAQ